MLFLDFKINCCGVSSIKSKVRLLTSKVGPQPDVIALEQVPYGLCHVLEVLGVVRVVLAADDAEAVKIESI